MEEERRRINQKTEGRIYHCYNPQWATFAFAFVICPTASPTGTKKRISHWCLNLLHLGSPEQNQLEQDWFPRASIYFSVDSDSHTLFVYLARPGLSSQRALTRTKNVAEKKNG